MPEIQSINNVVAFSTIDATGAWTMPIAMQIPDAIIITQVTYNSSNATKAALLVYMNNQIIASVVNISGFTSNPGTRVHVMNPIAQLSFGLYIPAINPIPVGAACLGDQIVIHMDFIRYKK